MSTRDLLLEWQQTGRAAKYGQCYIFGALQNSLLRAIGVATRQLSAFDARIDQSAQFVCYIYNDGFMTCRYACDMHVLMVSFVSMFPIGSIPTRSNTILLTTIMTKLAIV